MVSGMETELRVTLPGPEGSADARRALAVLERLLSLLGQVEENIVDEDARGKERTVWGFTDLQLGSLTATLAPNRPRSGVTTRTLATVAESTVDGLAAAEEREEVPHRWDRAAATTAVDLARLLGLLPSDGLKVELLANGHPLREVIVTRRAEEHLRSALAVSRQRSIGSAIGRLDTATLHDKREASLWLERTSGRVVVQFGPDHIELVRRAWGRRVEVSGLMTRDADGRLVSIRMRALDLLPEAGESPALVALVGIDPHLTNDMDPDEYLEMLRGAS